MIRRGWRAMVVLALLAGCNEALPPAEYGDPTSLAGTIERDGLRVQVRSPVRGERIARPSLSVVVDIGGLSIPDRALLSMGPLDGWQGPPAEQEVVGEVLRARFEVPVTHGTNALRLFVRDIGTGRQLIEVIPVQYDAPSPGARVESVRRLDDAGACGPGGEAVNWPATSATEVCVAGLATASGGRRPTAVTLGLPGAAAPVVVGPDGRFVGKVALQPGLRNGIELAVTDDAGRSATARVWIDQDNLPPEVTIVEPSAGLRTVSPTVMLRGVAGDEQEIASLWLESGLRGRTRIPVDTEWSVQAGLESGANSFTVVAQDRSGNEARATVDVFRDRVITLRRSEEGGGVATLRLDRDALSSLFPEADQRDVTMVRVPLRPLLVRTLEAIRDPSGAGLDTSAWGAAEWNMWRLLNMTPDTADLRGTSLEELLGIADALGIPAPRMLATLQGIGVQDPFVPIGTLTDVLLENLVGTHPLSERDPETGEPVLAITLYDALQDLAPLAERFGPVAPHPGFLVGRTEASVFEPGFVMSLTARTNLVPREGVDLETGKKDWIFLLDGDEVLSFDFLDPATFNVVGLVDEPVARLEFGMNENASFLRAGSTREANADPTRPGAFRGNGAFQTVPPWEIEPIVVEAAYRQYVENFAAAGYRATLRWDVGSIVDAAVVEWERGWIAMRTSGGIGNPPAPLYAWDMLGEIAQVRLHDGGLAEGDANLRFAVRDIPVGFEASELIERLRPTMEAQKDRLSRLLVGGGAVTRSTCDLWLVSSAGAAPKLVYRAQGEDGTEDGPLRKPGFWEDRGLTRKASTLRDVTGDGRERETVDVTEGAVWYVADGSDGVHRVEVRRVVEGDVELIVTPEGTP